MGKRLEKAPHKMDTQLANKPMKWYPILTVIEEMQLKNTVQYIVRHLPEWLPCKREKIRCGGGCEQPELVDLLVLGL